MAFLLVLLAGASLGAAVNFTTPDLCGCGYYDSTTQQLFTESIVVYFNETETLPADVFATQEYEHKKELGWTSIFRQGASPANVQISNTSQPTWLAHRQNPTSLELFVDPYTPDHLVVGGGIESVRQDIQYGSFRASMRSAHPYAGIAGGSAMSMMLPFNSSAVLELDMLNANNPNNASVSTLMNGETVTPNLGITYANLKNASAPDTSPWNWMEVRIDWVKTGVNWTVADNLVRSVRGGSVPDVPAPLTFKHWSTGDKKFMEGPPKNQSVANVQWVKAFFNTSTMTEEAHAEYDARCAPTLACSVDDITLRDSSPYTANATLAYTDPPRNEALRKPSAIAAGVFAAIGMVFLINAILARQVPWRLLNVSRWGKMADHGSVKEISSAGTSDSGSMLDRSGKKTPDSWLDESHVDSMATTAYNSRAPSPMRKSDDNDISALPVEEQSPKQLNVSRHPCANKRSSPFASVTSSSATLAESGSDSSLKSDGIVTITEEQDYDEKKTSTRVTEHEVPNKAFEAENEDAIGVRVSMAEVRESDRILEAAQHGHQVGTTSNFHTGADILEGRIMPNDPIAAVTIPAPAPPEKPTAGAPANVRVDYLAGLVAFSCVCVSMVHFCLTFMPAISEWGPIDHYSRELIAKKTVGPFLLTEAWIGPFFFTSSRFLSARYLRTGKLGDIANKILLRAPRMVIPCIVIGLAEYFFIEMGLTGALVYLPSISWTTWPSVYPYANFGGFINAIIDLAYLIPNGAPQIVQHYCVGVLWTIPVQLQNSYLVLLGVVMIREIKTPWKRFSFFFFCIINSYYAFTWGACFWGGLMFSDLENTYKWSKWINARPKVHYPFMTFLILIAIGCCSIFLVANDFNFDFLTVERGIHPDPTTGLPIIQTSGESYPNYYEPRLNTIVLAGALQCIVEMSTWVQWFLSLKVWIWIFPHIMTIYLIHGFVFWTLGSYVCVSLSVAGVPYWANMLVTWVLCYGGVIIGCIVVTPITDTTAKSACKNIWRWATETPVQKIATLGPYGKSLLLNRSGAPRTAPVSA